MSAVVTPNGPLPNPLDHLAVNRFFGCERKGRELRLRLGSRVLRQRRRAA